MSKYFLCTLGTSVANGLKDLLWAKQKTPGFWDEDDDTFSSGLDIIVAAALRDGDSFHKCSAEATVLRKAAAEPGDRIALFATDTGLGRICGEATKRLLVAGFGFADADVELVRIPGLQVADAERLRREGLPEFVKAVVDRIKNSEYLFDRFLCPVGGYKGIVPFLTVLGMAFRIPVLYTFEHISSLVRLPPLPFTLDRDLYARAKDALREIANRIEMPESEFLAKIKGYEEEERDAFLAFVEPSSRPGFVTSGAFTETFAPNFECVSAPVSAKAQEDLDILSHGRWYRTACRLVMDLQDPVIRMGYRGNHRKVKTTDLQVIKQGDTSVRVLGYESGGRFFVCRVFGHDDYEKTLDAQSCWRKDFPPESFREWSIPSEEIPEAVRNEESPYEAAMRILAEDDRANDEQKAARIAAEQVARNMERTLHWARQERASAEKGLRKVQRHFEEAKQALEREKAETARLRAVVEELQRQRS